MTELPPPLPMKMPLTWGFWVILFLPVLFVLLCLISGNSNFGGVAIGLLLLSLCLCPLYCSIRLAILWTEGVVARVLTTLGLFVGIAIVYLAISFAGCLALL